MLFLLWQVLRISIKNFTDDLTKQKNKLFYYRLNRRLVTACLFIGVVFFCYVCYGIFFRNETFNYHENLIDYARTISDSPSTTITLISTEISLDLSTSKSAITTKKIKSTSTKINTRTSTIITTITSTIAYTTTSTRSSTTSKRKTKSTKKKTTTTSPMIKNTMRFKNRTRTRLTIRSTRTTKIPTTSTTSTTSTTTSTSTTTATSITSTTMFIASNMDDYYYYVDHNSSISDPLFEKKNTTVKFVTLLSENDSSTVIKYTQIPSDYDQNETVRLKDYPFTQYNHSN